jgi:hypothetical protein
MLLALVGCSSRTEMPAVDAKRMESAPSSIKPDDEPTDGFENQQAVLIFLKLSSPWGTKAEFDRMIKLETTLEQLVEKAGVGEVDGNEIGGGVFEIFVYGPDATRIQQVVIGAVRKIKPPSGSYIIRRFGKPGASEKRDAL